MEKYLAALGTFVMVIVTIFWAALISGTLIWLLWESTMLVFYKPLLVYLPTDPGWWQCVKFAWFTSLIVRLFLPNVSIKKKE